TVRAAVAARLAGGAVSASVLQLTEGVLRMFWMKKATAATFALVAVFGFGIGVGVSVRHVPHAAANDQPAAKPGNKPPTAAEELKAAEAKLTALRQPKGPPPNDPTRPQAVPLPPLPTASPALADLKRSMDQKRAELDAARAAAASAQKQIELLEAQHQKLLKE